MMSSREWPIDPHRLQSTTGTQIERIERYIRIWQERCYPDGIPDECPFSKLSDTNQVPSYKKIAIAILNNDVHMYSLGFSRTDKTIKKITDIKQAKKDTESPQGKLL